MQKGNLNCVTIIAIIYEYLKLFQLYIYKYHHISYARFKNIAFYYKYKVRLTKTKI